MTERCEYGLFLVRPKLNLASSMGLKQKKEKKEAIKSIEKVQTMLG